MCVCVYGCTGFITENKKFTTEDEKMKQKRWRKKEGKGEGNGKDRIQSID